MAGVLIIDSKGEPRTRLGAAVVQESWSGRGEGGRTWAEGWGRRAGGAGWGRGGEGGGGVTRRVCHIWLNSQNQKLKRFDRFCKDLNAFERFSKVLKGFGRF